MKLEIDGLDRARSAHYAYMDIGESLVFPPKFTNNRLR